MSQYQSISIKKAMNNIVSNKYLLPAIQRKFVWSIEQIERLFDSILRGYPINSFMLWEIKDKEIKHNYKFYQFIKNYVQKFNEDNPDVAIELLEDNFFAIIDGQQRLTSLYIGLKGSYKIKMPSKWWHENEEKTPMYNKKLYLDISAPLSSDIDNEKEYNFKFMSDEEKIKDEKLNPNHIWFLVGEILNYENSGEVFDYLYSQDLAQNEFARKTLINLQNILVDKEMINYYLVDDQNQDKVLDIFLRTNSGGTPLTFSDLLMSISSANWKKYDAKEEMRITRETIYSYGTTCFDVSQDLILKSILVLTDLSDVSFKIKNFNRNNISTFENQWMDIKESIIATFRLLEQLGYGEHLLRSKNAIIPIAYYIYKNNLSNEIIKSTYSPSDKKNINKWLILSLLKGIFGGTSDTILKKIRDTIKNSSSKEFPLQEIIDSFKGETKNYSFDDEFINSLVESEFGSSDCSLVLKLLYQPILLTYGKAVHEDHMHPKSFFEDKDKNKLNSLNLSDSDKEFYLNNYNKLSNLQLLDPDNNLYKSDKPLKEWVNNQNISLKDLYLDSNSSLEISDFKSFIETRKTKIKDKLKNLLNT